MVGSWGSLDWWLYGVVNRLEIASRGVAADSALAVALNGLACGPEKHLGYVDLEPITGRSRGRSAVGWLRVA